jgi:uncharacterized repeat protein (TIGR03803 family)
MRGFKFVFALRFAIACAALTLSLAVCPQAQTFTRLATFPATGLEGNGPYAPVVQATDGNFYGTTSTGGPNNSYGDGTFFRVTPAGELTDLYNFCSLPQCADGDNPISAPVLGSDGNLYGAVGSGGSKAGNGSSGTIYKMTLEGVLTTLYTFCPKTPCTDGQGPNGIILASDGNFYGTTAGGGNINRGGTIFRVTPAGELTTLYTFCSQKNCNDGSGPFYAPIQGNDGNFYGVTYHGGNQDGGVLYELTASGTYQVLYRFCGTTGPCASSGPFMMVRDSQGNIFGVAARGSISAYFGTLFEFTSAGQYVTLHNFHDSGPIWPEVGLTIANDGNIYGVTGGGIHTGGSIFEITPAGKYTTLYTFMSASSGSEPIGPLFQGTDGALYGTTTYGPTDKDGSVFRVSNGLSPLVETVPAGGSVGQSVIILGNGLTSSTSVTFNGTPAVFTVESDTYIKATVPTGATTGTVSVVTPSGTLNSNPQFVVTH